MGALTLALTAPSLATIQPGDVLTVTVWNHPELSKQVSVDANGSVRVSFSGAVEVSGLDESVAAKKLTDALRPYVRDPAVTIEDSTQNSNLFVAGGPVGVLKYQPGETLAVAVADEMSQAVAPPAEPLDQYGQTTSKSNDANATLRSRLDLRDVKVQRDGRFLGTYDTVELSSSGQTGPVLAPGDTIVFQYKPVQVHVIGDVAQPGIAYLSPDQSVAEAISQSGGLLPTASSNHVLLQRDGKTHLLALGDPLLLGPAQNGDVVTIPEAPRVNVVGMVQTPGVVALKTDSTLLSAIYTAGGPAKFANLKEVEIVQGTSKTTYDITALTHGDMSQNPVLRDGDTVVVPRNYGIDFGPFLNALAGIAGGLIGRIP